MSTLKPPPNLLAFDAGENKSDIVQSKRENPIEEEVHEQGKAQTPQVNVRKGPNNFFNRPISSRRKAESQAVQGGQVDFTDLMQIKPSLL